MGLFFGRRETLNEQLAREAGLSPRRERRRPLRVVLSIGVVRKARAGKAREVRAGDRGYLDEHEVTRGLESFRLEAPDRPPPGFG